MTEVERPASPGIDQTQSLIYRPDELNPDLANASMARVLITQLGKPSILNKPFIVRYGIFSALNHSPDNPTGYNCTIRLNVYHSVMGNSINLFGEYFEKIWAYLMKPKWIIQGLNQHSFNEEEKGETITEKVGRWLGRGKNNNADNRRE